MHPNVVHCKREEYDVYIGRTRRNHGEWGNPFSHKQVPGTTLVATRDEAISRYREWLWFQIREHEISLERLAALHGKKLGCWCAPDPCHGEVLAAAAAWAANELDKHQACL